MKKTEKEEYLNNQYNIEESDAIAEGIGLLTISLLLGGLFVGTIEQYIDSCKNIRKSDSINKDNNLVLNSTFIINDTITPTIYDIGTQIITLNVDENTLKDYYSNIPDGYLINKIGKNSDNNYDIYFVNTEKVLAFENDFGYIIDNQKIKEYK